MPILGRMNKSETQTVFDHSEMKHQIREKDKQDPEIDPRSYLLPSLASRACLGVGDGSLAPGKRNQDFKDTHSLNLSLIELNLILTW